MEADQCDWLHNLSVNVLSNLMTDIIGDRYNLVATFWRINLPGQAALGYGAISWTCTLYLVQPLVGQFKAFHFLPRKETTKRRRLGASGERSTQHRPALGDNTHKSVLIPLAVAMVANSSRAPVHKSL